MRQQEVTDAIDRFFTDRSRAASETLSEMENIHDHLEIRMEALRDDIAAGDED